VKRLIFSSVFEADFAEITAYLFVSASPEISIRWEKAVIRVTGFCKNFRNWEEFAEICVQRVSEALALKNFRVS